MTPEESKALEHTLPYLEQRDPSLPIHVAQSWDRVANPKENHHLMSTMTMERPALVAPAAASNGTAYATVLDEKAKGGVGGYLKSVPRRFRAWLQGVQKTFRTSAIGSAIGRGFSRLKGAVRSIWSRFGGVTLAVSLAGALLTCQKGRQFLRKVVHHTYRVVSAPVRFVGGLLKSLLNNFGWGRKVTAKVESGYNRAVEFCATKFEKAMTWLDEREDHWIMRAARGGFQAAVASCVIGYKGKGSRKSVQGIVPERYQTAVGIAHWAFMPEIGTPDPRGSAGYRFQKAVRGLWSDLRGTRTADEASEFLAKGSVEGGLAYAPDGTTTPVEVITDGDGDRWVKFDGQLFPAEDLPNDLSLTPQAIVKQLSEAKSLTEHLEAQVAATTATAPPANRADKRAAAKAHGPAGKK